MLKIAICDDERISAEIIAAAAKSAFGQKGIDTEGTIFQSVEELDAGMKTHRYDLLLLDIDMPDMDGIAYGRKLREEQNPVHIVYITNHEERVFEALQVHPGTFIRKSELIERAHQIVESWLMAHRKETPPALVIHRKDCEQKLFIHEIIYIESRGRYQYIHTRMEKDPVSMIQSMEFLEGQLSEHGFLRIHKSFLVNYQCIRKISDNKIVLTNGEEIPVSRRKVKSIREEYLRLMTKDEIVLV